MTFMNLHVAQRHNETIGDSVSRALKEISVSHPEFQVISIIPRIFTYFGTSPERFETTEVDVVLKYDEQKGVYNG